jgi:hypothetical protein
VTGLGGTSNSETVHAPIEPTEPLLNQPRNETRDLPPRPPDRGLRAAVRPNGAGASAFRRHRLASERLGTLGLGPVSRY